ncbi:MAG: glycogen/starch synthase, partial [Nanoarchaeota archaeon]|nr:glycogen/starch synthase [Nanoarchaeota archaeon]
MDKKDVPIFITTTETSELSDRYGFLGAYATDERGGLSLVIPPLTQGLHDLGYNNVHVVVPNVKKAFKQKKRGVTDKRALEERLHIPERFIHLVESKHIRNLDGIYDESKEGGHERTLAIFQAKAAHLIKDNLGFYNRRGIHISNDGTGGMLNAYLKMRDIPILHVAHNVHGRDIPLAEYDRADFSYSAFEDNFFLTWGDPTRLANTETSIKNADFVGVVGHQFKKELLSGSLNQFVSAHILNELLIKEKFGKF